MKSLFALALLAAPATVFAGVDATWNDCAGGAGATSSQNFTCAGASDEIYPLALQFRAPVSLASFVSLSSYLDLGTPSTPSAPLAPFWHFEPAACNGGAVKGVIVSPLPAPGATACAALPDLWDANDDGVAEGIHTIASYGADYQRPGVGHFIVLGARGDAVPIAANTRYFGHELRFSNANRPGSGAGCAGCADPVVIVYNLARLESNDGSAAVEISGPDAASDCAQVNGATPADCGLVPVKSLTWGRLKAIFR